MGEVATGFEPTTLGKNLCLRDQVVRALVSYTKGRGFESHPGIDSVVVRVHICKCQS